MNRQVLVAVGVAALLVTGMSGCGSDRSETSGETSSAADADGAAAVTIDGRDQEVTGPVVCSDMGGNTSISIGRPSDGVGAVVTTGDSPTVVSVALGIIDGVRLAYASGTGQGEATIEKSGSTYTISGTATGRDMTNPTAPQSRQFDMQATCP